MIYKFVSYNISSSYLFSLNGFEFVFLSGDSENDLLLLHCYAKCYNSVYNTSVVAPTGLLVVYIFRLREMVCVFALLHVVHSVSSCPFLLVT